MSSFIITPKVNETQEFIEIANDFSNPLELVREAISNSFDAKAKKIEIYFDVVFANGNRILEIKLFDDGIGMDKEGVQSFFDLGNSFKREDSSKIGEKGHGTKVYFNSAKIQLVTVNNGVKITAEMNEPFSNLYSRQIPKVTATEEASLESNGTRITITGYNNNRKDKFTHEILKDYILWFTKFGSIEGQFEVLENENVILLLKGLNRNEPETLNFGHQFPDESETVQKLFEQHMTKAPEYYSKRVVKNGNLKNNPEIKFQAVFSIEGNRVKQSYNPMLRRQGYSAPEGSYTVQDRYGLWICKDHIPIQKKNEWLLLSKGYEFTRFHAFVNCQDLRLTANRGSVDNTPSEILTDLKAEIEKIYASVIESDDWRNLSWLEEESDSFKTADKEKKDFEWRKSKINRANIAQYKGINLVQPERESGVYSLIIQLLTIDDKLLPFQILDYDTHSGIDVIVKGDKTTPINQAKIFYVEFKFNLSQSFNHSFENLHSIICWDTDIKQDEIVIDVNREERKMQIVPPAKENDYTKYYLDNPRKAHKIEVYVLKDFLREKLKIEFRPRTANSIV
ncbi:MAG TPA: ATP-binding protein [Cyclobacteriaceae bacterium]|nr:ATP-binding protein [Cyclobacteriaceae bacterium]